MAITNLYHNEVILGPGDTPSGKIILLFHHSYNEYFPLQILVKIYKILRCVYKTLKFNYYTKKKNEVKGYNDIFWKWWCY